MTWRQVLVEPSGQAGPGSLNDAGQVAFTTLTADGPRARFFDGTEVRKVAGDSPARAAAVNGSGQIAGHLLQLDGSTRAFRWSPQSPDDITLVDTRPGLNTVSNRISAAGQVTGNIIQSRLNFPQAFRWTPGSVLQPLESSGSIGIPLSEGRLINGSGVVAGLSSTDEGTARAALWIPGQPVRDLGALGGLASAPTALNEAGQVVGRAEIATGVLHAFLWSQAAGIRDLGTLGGGTSAANALNDQGWVVGSADTADFASQAFVWRDGVMTALGTLGGRNSAATAVSEAGWVGGTAQTADGSAHAFIWTTESGMVDLNTRATLVQPAVLQAVIALGDDGSVLVESTVGLMLLRP